jgi:hypothetical protein
MKTFIITTLLVVGVSLRPQMAPTADDMRIHIQATSIGASNQLQAAVRVLNNPEMEVARGGSLFDCDQFERSNGDTYISCCVNLWLFRLCVEVNWSELQRLYPF